MEGFSEDVKPVNEMSYDTAHLDVVVQNNTNTPQKINLLSNYEEDNTNCTYSIGHDKKLYDYAKKVLLSKPYYFDAIRLQVSDIKQFENHIDISGRGINGAKIETPIYPLAYMSPNQFQNNVVDIRMPLVLDGRTEFETELVDGLAVIFLKQMSSEKKKSAEEIEYNKASDDRRSWFPISLENVTDKNIEYNICFSPDKQSLEEDEKVKAIVGKSATLSYFTDQLIKSEKYVVFKSVHACSNDKQFFNSTIEFTDVLGGTQSFKLIDYMSIMELVDKPTEKTIVTGQFLTNMTEFNIFHPINTSNKTSKANIKFTIPAKTKIIFFIKTEKINTDETNN